MNTSRSLPLVLGLCLGWWTDTILYFFAPAPTQSGCLYIAGYFLSTLAFFYALFHAMVQTLDASQNFGVKDYLLTGATLSNVIFCASKWFVTDTQLLDGLVIALLLALPALALLAALLSSTLDEKRPKVLPHEKEALDAPLLQVV